MVYAHAQKNIGIAGSTIGIVRDTLLDRKKLATTPYMCDLSEMIKRQSLLNTVPVFPIYVNQ
jgi:phosphoserine aminotransferase